jgi:hypothetical protein
MKGNGKVSNCHPVGENRSTAILVAVSVGSRGAECLFELMDGKPAFKVAVG